MYCPSTSRAVRCASRTLASVAAPSRYAVSDIDATRSALATISAGRARRARARSSRSRSRVGDLVSAPRPARASAPPWRARAPPRPGRWRRDSGRRAASSIPRRTSGRIPGSIGIAQSRIPSEMLGNDQIDRCCNRAAIVADSTDTLAAASLSVCPGQRPPAARSSESVGRISSRSLVMPSTACRSSTDETSVSESPTRCSPAGLRRRAPARRPCRSRRRRRDVARPCAAGCRRRGRCDARARGVRARRARRVYVVSASSATIARAN